MVDDRGHLVGVVSHEAVSSVPDAARGGRPIASVMARDDGGDGLRARLEDPLEALLAHEGLGRLGAVMAVDGDGVLRGIVTIDAVRRALHGALRLKTVLRTRPSRCFGELHRLLTASCRSTTFS